MAEATKPGRPCLDCEGQGRVEVPVIRNDRRYTLLGRRVETCMSCDGSGRGGSR